MDEKRKNERKKCNIKTVIRKQLQDDSISLMEFISTNLSMGGVFISTEDLSLFDLGDELEILVDDNGEKYYEGKAKVVRSARVFSEKRGLSESGYGLMFINPSKEFTKLLTKKIDNPEFIVL